MSYETHNFMAGEVIRASAINEMDAKIQEMAVVVDDIEDATDEEIRAIVAKDL